MTAEDHQAMMDLLGISSLRPGRNGMDPNAPNYANYDESKATLYPNLPDPLVLKNGQKVTTAEMWWKQRRPEIVEDFDREIYGRVPKNTPKVNWEVISTTNEKNGDVPVITKQLIGHVDNSSYPDISVDIRIISATNKSLEEEVIAGNFREDLFYRLNVIEIKVPPLRERKTDLRALAQHFLEKYSNEMGKKISKFSSYALDLLKKYDFPGNIRELENLLERSVALSTTNIILPDSLALSLHKRRWIEGFKDRRFDLDEVARGVALDSILEEIERGYLKKALDCSDGNKNKASELLGISFRSLRYRLDKLGIDK